METTATDDKLRWNLGDLYASPDDPRLAVDMAKASDRASELARSYRGRMAALKPVELAEAIRGYEQLMDLAYRPGLYASLLFAGQTADEKAQALLDRTRQATTEAFNEVKFVDIELKKIPDDAFARLLDAPELKPYRHFLAAQRKLAPYTLDRKSVV